MLQRLDHAGPPPITRLPVVSPHYDDILSRAVEVTKLWDQLNGQKLNDGKSTVWGTTAAARRAIKAALPDMKLEHTFQALERTHLHDEQR